MTWQPAPSIPLASQPSSWRRPVSCPSILFLSSSSFPSLHCDLQDCLGKHSKSCYVPIPFQFASFYCGQEVFVGLNGLPSSISHLFIGHVVSVGDAEELSEASHLHGLYPSICVCCYCPRLTGVHEYGHDQGTHQCDL